MGTRCEGDDIESMERTQRPIVFGGHQLPEINLAYTVSNDEKHALLKSSPQPGPAGEGSPEARLLNVSRWSLAARIRHGVPMSQLLDHLQTLALVEEKLLSYQE